MPQYDFRCKCCGRRFSLHFNSVAQYAVATPQCPDCDSAALDRVISGVATPQAQRDYRKMSSREMLSVLEAGEKKQVDDMFRQVNSAPTDGSGG
ncbi:MAG: hypothetical protein OXG92_08300 [Chloroflexi bacterium]|nr:hypothetical protein [Chloroflexota bacterium]MCY3581257.1 hypothetical protein [Chloroflexota bacterium]MCY3716450.1 hypothetical protein [Chloroflexota bacterium]MDE2651311.1 hypothetical protein [Chloroflexota bacterium]MXV92550.1 hypothetical protein [Chloroflexota bacterium]